MKSKKAAFTLVEVLVSITILTLVLMALYKSSDLMRASNLHLFKYLQKASTTLKGSTTLYKDLMYAADHNITINTEEEFHRLSIANTSHSLYGLAQAKVVWLVHKKDNTLLRIEGGKYNIPLGNEEQVEIDVIAKNIIFFKLYKSKKQDKILAIIQVTGQDPQLFMSQNLPDQPLTSVSNSVNPKQNQNSKQPSAIPIKK